MKGEKALVCAVAIATAISSPAFASTWPDEDWPYAKPEVATAEDLILFKKAKECALRTEDGERVFITAAPDNFAVFTMDKAGTIRRAYNAYAERYGIDFCAKYKGE
jgi:hypothetical protein